MMTVNHKSMLELAQKHTGSNNEQKQALVEAVLASVENGLVSPSMLKANLAKLPFVNVDINKLEKSIEFRFWTPVEAREELGETEPTKDVWAYGRSQTWQDALLHAILGYLRECEKGQR